ncbi:MAG: TIM barrel protein [Phycisphaerales bacterium]|nr:TIM barrel protein [Phycisphaerales bacterium]
MLLTLHTNSVRSLVRPSRGEPSVDLVDLPRMAREEFDLYGLNLTTDLLAGAVRSQLVRIRDAADKAGCACLLLIEQDPLPLADADDEKALAGLERVERVIKAAQILGCNSIAIRVSGKGDEASLERAVDHMKEAAEKAERHEVNLLITPHLGLTAEPDRVTSIIKKVGGFRVGTFPDFETAAGTEDPVTYLRRLTPYASAVCASTIEFVEVPEGAMVAPPAESVKKKTTKKSRSKKGDDAGEGSGEDAPPESGDDGAPDDGAPAKTKTKSRSKKKAGSAADDDAPGESDAKASSKKKGSGPPPKDDDDEGDEQDELDLARQLGLSPEDDLDALAALLEDIAPPPEHRPYALDPLVAAVVSVGYDGTLAIDYRGKGDVREGIVNSRLAIEAAIVMAQQK